MKTATIILNRNLPKETNLLVEHLKKFDIDHTDIFVVEAGSDNDKLSKYCTWHVNSPNVMVNGLRYARGMNYGLLQLWKDGKWDKYDSFFLLTNDTTFPKKQSTVRILREIMIKNSRVGIVSPCSNRWGERSLIGKNSIKYFWFIHNNAYFFRKTMFDQLINSDEPYYKNFIFDGTNFRGYLSEIEIIAKAYANDWAAAITTQIMAEEDETLLAKKNKLIKTESYEENIDLYIDEGLKWAKKKYGFNNRWQMIQYSRLFYEKFFEYFPEEKKYKI
jgi:hypothetical protein